MRKISNVEVLDKYQLSLGFDDGVHGTVDLSRLVGKGVFAVWNDARNFAQVRVGSMGELIWNDEVDLCPDSLYLEVTGKRPEDIYPSLRREPIRA